MDEKRKNDLIVAKCWIDRYERKIKPILKRDILLSPIFISNLCAEVSNATTYILALNNLDATKEEICIKNQLLGSLQDLIKVLEENQPEFEQFEKTIDMLLEETEQNGFSEQEKDDFDDIDGFQLNNENIILH